MWPAEKGTRTGMDVCSQAKNKEKQVERAVFLPQVSLRKRFHKLFSECRITTTALCGLVFLSSPWRAAEAVIWSRIQAHKNPPEDKNTWLLVVYLLAEENAPPFLQHRTRRNCNQILSERGLASITRHKDFQNNYVLHNFCPIYQNYTNTSGQIQYALVSPPLAVNVYRLFALGPSACTWCLWVLCFTEKSQRICSKRQFDLWAVGEVIDHWPMELKLHWAPQMKVRWGLSGNQGKS